MSRLSFHDHMAGFVSRTERDPRQAWLEGRRAWRALSFDLDVEVDDLDAFLADPRADARATGTIECADLGGTLPVTDGRWNLFVPQAGGGARMRYRLPTRDGDGRPLTLSGLKEVADDPGFDVWTDTTTLYVRVLDGHVGPDDEHGATVVASGILRITLAGFLALLRSLRARDPRAVARFGRAFAGDLFRTYAGAVRAGGLPDFPDPDGPGLAHWRGEAPGAWHAPPELPGLHRRILGLTAGDGRCLTLHHIRRDPASEPPRGPVLLLHGTGVRADLFHGAPGGPSFTRALVDAGWDVWLLNWRASIDLAPAPYTLDQAALYDHPAAIRFVLDATGRDELAVVAHCQGSTSFVITALAGLAPQATRVVSSAVSLHPVVPWTAKVKISAVPPLLGALTPYADAQWGILPPTPLAGAVARVARAVRGECDDPVCALGNYMYGTGPDVLWRHAHLDPATHHWASREFAWAPFRFLRQMGASVRAGHLVPVDGLPGLPASYVGRPDVPEHARWTFVAGTRNRLFLAASQERTHAHFARHRPGRDRLVLVPGYGHLDVLFGAAAHRDAFPALLAGLEA